MGVFSIIALMLASPIQKGRDIQRTRAYDERTDRYCKTDRWLREHNAKYDDGHIVDKTTGERIM